jgi:hypothetical protein
LRVFCLSGRGLCYGPISRPEESCWLWLCDCDSDCAFSPPQSWGFEITHKDAPQSVGLLWTSDQPVAETSTWWTHNTHNRQTSMPPAGFEPLILAGDRLQTHALDSSATGIGYYLKKAQFSEKSFCIPMCFDFLYNYCLKYRICHLKKLS